jgi:hypothetical protein
MMRGVSADNHRGQEVKNTSVKGRIYESNDFLSHHDQMGLANGVGPYMREQRPSKGHWESRCGCSHHTKVFLKIRHFNAALAQQKIVGKIKPANAGLIVEVKTYSAAANLALSSSVTSFIDNLTRPRASTSRILTMTSSPSLILSDTFSMRS